MKISMWHLYEKLKQFSPAANIADGLCCLQNVRVLSTEDQVLFSDYVYLTRINNAFGWDQEQDTLLLINQRDILIIYHVSFYELLNEVMNIFDYFRNMDEELKRAAVAANAYDELLKIIYSYYHLPMMAIDNNLCILAKTAAISYIPLWEDIWKSKHMPEGFLSVFNNDENNKKFFTSKKSFLMNPVNRNASRYYRKLLVIPFRNQQFVVGKVLVNLFQDYLSPGDFLMGDIFAEYLSRAAVHRYTEDPHSMDHYLVRCIREHDYSLEETKVFYYANNWDPAIQLKLYVLRDSSSQLKESEIRWYCGLFEMSIENIFTFLLDMEILILAPADREIQKRLLQIFKNNLQKFRFYCGSSLPFCGLENFDVFYRQASDAAEWARTDKKHTAAFEEICYDSIIHEITAVFPCKPWIPRELYILREYDKKNGTEYLKTLKEYLENNESIIRAAESLHIHQSTMKYRIRKIQEMISFHKQDTYFNKYLSLCIKLMESKD